MSDPDTIERLAMDLLAEALDQPEGKRDEWVRERCGSDDLLFQRVMALIDADSGKTLLRTGGAGEDSSEEPHPERAGAYNITDLIGQGGMGAVYLGERDAGDFEHRVAIKVIRAGALKATLVERFTRERQILASLNHPNIARLFDGGYLNDGSPYIVMEYVDGDPILDWADEKGLDETARIALFMDICAAISHAHQNLVVHRDITPSNVLVTHDGIVKLIDFGIAKPHDISTREDDSESSKVASMSFTPGYAAPERLQGAAANTLSDVYSLGKLLGDLLPNHAGDPDLAAIVAKAGSKDPSSRYASVDALADDLENYRSGRPVEAREGGRGYRFAKFLDRHSLAVGFGTAAVIALSAALIVTLFQYNRAERALTSANARFDEARELSQALIFDVYDSLERVSGTLEPREELAGVVRDYINDLAIDEEAPEDVLFEVGTMQLRLSDLYGGVGMGNFGDLQASADLLAEAEVSLKLALEKAPDNADALAELIMVKRMQTMQSVHYTFDLEAAARDNAEAAALAERGFAIEGADERPFLRHLWSVRTDLLQILSKEEEHDAVIDNLAAWRPELTPDMYERLGGGEEMGAYLAYQHASTLNALERHTEALEAAADAIAYRETQHADNPENYYQATQLMVAVAEQVTAHRALGQEQAARAAADRAVQLARETMAADPNDAGGPESVSRMLVLRARTIAMAGDFETALADATESVAVARELDNQYPGDLFYQQMLHDALAVAARLNAVLGQEAAACNWLAEADALSAVMLEAGADAAGTEMAMEEIAEARSVVGCAPDALAEGATTATP